MEFRRSQRTAVLTNKTVKSNTAANLRKAAIAANKRKASVTEGETSQGQPSNKRAAFGDITNKKSSTSKRSTSKVSEKKSLKSLICTDTDGTIESSQENISESSQGSLNKQLSQESQISIQSLSDASSKISSQSTQPHATTSEGTSSTNILHIEAPLPAHERTDLQYTDIDKENAHDIFQSPEYAQDIFNYYKSRESDFLVDDYINRQSEVTPAMRSVLVDWLVEVQENFELNHETLYLAVRLVDHYLMKKDVTKEALQLVGAAAVFIGCKFDERIPPMVDDFLYICDDAYNRHEFVRMEKDILRTVNFCLGMPISYRFGRRFAKAGKKSMSTLTLARYINETALMSYKILKYKESLIAAGCLRLAIFMTEPDGKWDDTLVYYSGYADADLKDIVIVLNSIMHNKNPNLHTVENKYSHQVFFEVAKLTLLPMCVLYAADFSSNTPTVITDISHSTVSTSGALVTEL